MRKIPSVLYTVCGDMVLIPMDKIQEYHKNDFGTFQRWMRGKTVVVLSEHSLGVHVNNYEKWWLLFS